MQYIENERGWTDLIVGHGFWVLIRRPPICVSLSLHVVVAVHRWWCWGLCCHSLVVCGASFTICQWWCGALVTICQWWPPVAHPSLLMVWWCGVPCCGSRVVVVGVPCHEGGGWLGWRALITHGHSMMVVWWALSIVVVVSPIVEGGGGGGHLSLIVVESGGGRLSPVVVEGGGGGGQWVLMGCCGFHAMLWWGWLLVVVGGQSSLWVDDSGGGPCPSLWGPGVMDDNDIVIWKVAIDVACSVKLYACHVSSLVVASCVGCHHHCCSSLLLSLSLSLLLLLASVVVAVANMVVTV